MNLSGSLRKEIGARAAQYAIKHNIPFYLSLGRPPTMMFEPFDVDLHGNFLPASYRAILSHPEWEKRLKKSHQRKNALPAEKRAQARELDSSTPGLRHDDYAEKDTPETWIASKAKG